MGLAEENQHPEVHGSQGQPVGTAQILNWKKQKLSKGVMQELFLLHNPVSHPKPTLDPPHAVLSTPVAKIQVTHPNSQHGIFLRGFLQIPTILTIPKALGRPKAEKKCYWIQARHKNHRELPGLNRQTEGLGFLLGIAHTKIRKGLLRISPSPSKQLFSA